MATTDSRAKRRDPTIVGTPANLAAVCREAEIRYAQGRIPSPSVQMFRLVEGFEVPKDGVWTINSNLVNPGEVHDIQPGSLVTYTRIQGQDGPTTRDYVLDASQSVPGSAQVVDVPVGSPFSPRNLRKPQ